MDKQLELFLEKLLFNTLRIDFHFYKYPYTNITSIDRQLRKGLVASQELYKEFIDIFEKIEKNHIYMINDKYFLQYIIFAPYHNCKDIISIGPYTRHPVDEFFYNKIAKINHLSFSQVSSLKDYMFQLPLFDNNMQLLSVLHDILSFISSDISNLELQEIDFTIDTQVENNYIPNIDFEMYVQTIEKRYKIEEKLFNAISIGDKIEALAANREFLNCLFEPRMNDVLHEKKYMLTSVNTLCRKAVQKSKIHPVYLHELSGKHSKAINLITDLSKVESYCEKIISNYCYLVKTKSRIHYSSIVRNTINYIELNLNSALSLSVLANQFHVSPPYLSGLFKNETGVTVTYYINQQRIHTALELLNSSDMQVQDISAYVGIQDINYFTKLFKKLVGCTPSKYRKDIKKCNGS